MRVAVAGGTGTVGRHVVERLERHGHQTVVLSRSQGVDLLTAVGLDEALTGCESVVDVTNIVATGRRAAVKFFSTVTGHLLAAEKRVGVQHHVALSIVGVEEVPMGYYQGKVAQEQIVEEGPIPWSILRATQFHEFAEQMLERTSVGPLALVPKLRVRPVAAREVGAALAELATGPARGRVPEFGGPAEEELSDLVRRFVHATSRRTRVLAVPVPGAAGKVIREGALIPRGSSSRGSETYTDWLNARSQA